MKKQFLFLWLGFSISFNGWAKSIARNLVISTPAEVGVVLAVDYKYTVAADSYIFCGINLQSDRTYVLIVAGQGLDLAAARTDVAGSFNITLPDETMPTADLTAPLHYKISIKLKYLPTFTWLAGDYLATRLNFSDPLGSDKNALVDEITFYPNPVHDVLKIANVNNLANASFSIVDILGKTVVQPKAMNNDAINVFNLSAGMYILSLSSKESA